MFIKRAISIFLIIALCLTTILPPGYAYDSTLRPVAARIIPGPIAGQEVALSTPAQLTPSAESADNKPENFLRRMVSALFPLIMSGFLFSCMGMKSLDSDAEKFLIKGVILFMAAIVPIGIAGWYSDKKKAGKEAVDVKVEKYLKANLRASKKDARAVAEQISILLRRKKIPSDLNRACLAAAELLERMRRRRRSFRRLIFTLTVVVPLSALVYFNFNEIQKATFGLYKAWRHRGLLEYIPVLLAVTAVTCLTALRFVFIKDPQAAGLALLQGWRHRELFSLRRIFSPLVMGTSGLVSFVTGLVPFFGKPEKTYWGFTQEQLRYVALISLGIGVFTWFLCKCSNWLSGARSYKNIPGLIILAGAGLSAVTYALWSDVNGALAFIPGIIVISQIEPGNITPEPQRDTLSPDIADSKPVIEAADRNPDIGRLLVEPLISRIERQLSGDDSPAGFSGTSTKTRSVSAGLPAGTTVDFQGAAIAYPVIQSFRNRRILTVIAGQA